MAAISSPFGKTYDSPDQRNGRRADRNEKPEKEVSSGGQSARGTIQMALLVKGERLEKIGVTHWAKSK